VSIPTRDRSTVPPAGVADATPARWWSWPEPRDFMVYAAFAVILVFFSITLADDGFLTSHNLLNIGRQSAAIAVMAVGTVFVLSAGEIDLSIGSIVALAALVAALVMQDSGMAPAVGAALAVGLGVGLFNGLVTVKLGVPSFLVTLGSLSIVSGIARSISDLETIPILNESFNALFGTGDLGPVPGLIIWALGAVIVGHLYLHHTRFGRRVLSTGGNKEAAEAAGISTDNVRIAVLVISAVAAALAGLLLAGRLNGARYTLGEADMLTVIAAVIVGGTSLFGGRGSVVGALFGALIMGMLTNGLILMGLTVSEQLIARGAIIILAVALTVREVRKPGRGRLALLWRSRETERNTT
jgi:ribose transport system permease protein